MLCFVVVVLFILGKVARSDEEISGIGLHDIKQGINQKKKKVEVKFSSPK